MNEKIGFHDADDTDYPNLALMKLSAWHKAQGDNVEWFRPLLGPYDHVYSGKVFTFTEGYPYLPDHATRGGTGYGNPQDLDDHVEHAMPDYDLYNINYSMGFLTRGCPRNCPWCFVPEKEGDVREHADIEEFAAHRDVVLMDNNVLAHPHGLAQIEKMAKLGLRVDFNQGLDARMIDDGIARLLSKLTWLKPLRLACDFKGQMKSVQKAVELLRWHNVKPNRYFCYLLVKDVPDAVERVRFLKGLLVDPYAQPYRDKENTPPTEEQRLFARWVNDKGDYRIIPWEDYRKEYRDQLAREESAVSNGGAV